MKNTFLGLLSIAIAFVFLALVGEALLRINHVARETLTGNTILQFELDVLGWVGTGNYSHAGRAVDAAGDEYDLRVTTDAAGFRAFGDPAVEVRRKILVLGDSFTHALQVSDDKTYFSIVGESLDLELFALGVGGYGTMQQYLMLERYLEEIQPDLVLLQFCPNDFINNHYELELSSPRNNNGMRRPYWIDGEVVYLLPRAMPGLRHFANAHSRLLYFILTRLDRVMLQRRGESPEAGADLDSPPFRESVAITGELVKKIRGRVPASVPIYAFSTMGGPAYGEQFRQIAEAAGVSYVEGVSDRLALARENGVNIFAADGQHWNNAGHAAVAGALTDYLSRQPALDVAP